MDVLSQVVGNHKALSGRGLYEDSLKVNQLWTSIYFLKLLSTKFKCTLSQLCLGRGLRLELLLDDSRTLISLCAESFPCLEVRVWFIFTDGLLYIKRVYLIRNG
jgi:hypothetical protein